MRMKQSWGTTIPLLLVSKAACLIPAAALLHTRQSSPPSSRTCLGSLPSKRKAKKTASSLEFPPPPLLWEGDDVISKTGTTRKGKSSLNSLSSRPNVVTAAPSSSDNNPMSYLMSLHFVAPHEESGRETKKSSLSSLTPKPKVVTSSSSRNDSPAAMGTNFASTKSNASKKNLNATHLLERQTMPSGQVTVGNMEAPWFSYSVERGNPDDQPAAEATIFVSHYPRKTGQDDAMESSLWSPAGGNRYSVPVSRKGNGAVPPRAPDLSSVARSRVVSPEASYFAVSNPQRTGQGAATKAPWSPAGGNRYGFAGKSYATPTSSNCKGSTFHGTRQDKAGKEQWSPTGGNIYGYNPIPASPSREGEATQSHWSGTESSKHGVSGSSYATVLASNTVFSFPQDTGRDDRAIGDSINRKRTFKGGAVSPLKSRQDESYATMARWSPTRENSYGVNARGHTTSDVTAFSTVSIPLKTASKAPWSPAGGNRYGVSGRRYSTSSSTTNGAISTLQEKQLGGDTKDQWTPTARNSYEVARRSFDADGRRYYSTTDASSNGSSTQWKTGHGDAAKASWSHADRNLHGVNAQSYSGTSSGSNDAVAARHKTKQGDTTKAPGWTPAGGIPSVNAVLSQMNSLLGSFAASKTGNARHVSKETTATTHSDSYAKLLSRKEAIKRRLEEMTGSPAQDSRHARTQKHTEVSAAAPSPNGAMFGKKHSSFVSNLNSTSSVPRQASPPSSAQSDSLPGRSRNSEDVVSGKRSNDIRSARTAVHSPSERNSPIPNDKSSNMFSSRTTDQQEEGEILRAQVASLKEKLAKETRRRAAALKKKLKRRGKKSHKVEDHLSEQLRQERAAVTSTCPVTPATTSPGTTILNNVSGAAHSDASGKRVIASRAARVTAIAFGIDVATIGPGSGPSGRIMVKDVRAAAPIGVTAIPFKQAAAAYAGCSADAL